MHFTFFAFFSSKYPSVIAQDYHFKFQDYRRNGGVRMAEHKQYGEHKYTHDVCCNVQLILCWSVIGASWLDYCVGRCSLAPSDGEHCSAVYADALADPPIVTTYMQATHPRQTAIPRTTYVVQDTISSGPSKGGRRAERGKPWKYFTVINDRAAIVSFFTARFSSSSCKLRRHKNRLENWIRTESLSQSLPDEKTSFPWGAASWQKRDERGSALYFVLLLLTCRA